MFQEMKIYFQDGPNDGPTGSCGVIICTKLALSDDQISKAMVKSNLTSRSANTFKNIHDGQQSNHISCRYNS